MSKSMIFGDWGTSSCRLYLYQGNQIIDSKTGPGIKSVGCAKTAFLDLVAPWLETYQPQQALLSGMVGSNIGWKDAGYVECPAAAEDFRGKLISLEVDNLQIRIVPGIKTSLSLTHTADVMRGEETQILGWFATHNTNGLLCLPGTHTKWVKVEDGKIQNFMTSVNGELFEIILNHSVLVGGINLPPACIGDEFRHGIEAGASDIPLTQRLMSVRSNQILDDYDAIQAKSYLLGILIGSDVAASLKHANGAAISVIGGSSQASFYAEAIRFLGGNAKIYGGQEASLTGLRRILAADRDIKSA